MSERNYSEVIDGEPYFPKMSIKIKKGGGKKEFRYSINLTAFVGEETKEIKKFNNYHDGKCHHVHDFKPDGTSEKKEWKFTNLKEIRECIHNNWLKWIKVFEKELLNGGK